MRTSLLTATVLSLVFATSVSAQTGIGVRAGLNVSTFSGDELPNTKPHLGFVGGLFAEVPLSSVFTFRPEVLYSQKGVSGDTNGSSFVVDYIEIPLLAQVTAPVAASRLMLGAYAGPTVAFKVSEKVESTIATFNTDRFETVDVGLAVGGGLGAGPFAVDLRYTLGLINVANDAFLNPVDGQTTLRNGVFSVAASYTFGR